MKVWLNNKHKYTNLEVKKIVEVEINDYLIDNPTHWVFDGKDRFVCNIVGSICEVKRTKEIIRFTINDKDKAFTNKWCAIEPMNFMRAVKAWDCGATILRKTDDLNPPVTYINDGEVDRDDIVFDGVDILTGQWFKYIR